MHSRIHSPTGKTWNRECYNSKNRCTAGYLTKWCVQKKCTAYYALLPPPLFNVFNAVCYNSRVVLVPVFSAYSQIWNHSSEVINFSCVPVDHSLRPIQILIFSLQWGGSLVPVSCSGGGFNRKKVKNLPSIRVGTSNYFGLLRTTSDFRESFELASQLMGSLKEWP